MPNSESVGEIISSAQAARRDLSDLEQDLQNGIDEIDFKVFSEERTLTSDEKARRQQLRASQTEIRDAFIELAFVTVRRLDDSNEVERLNARMAQINRGLKDDLNDLQEIVDFAEKAAKAADTIAKVVQKVAEKAAAVIG